MFVKNKGEIMIGISTHGKSDYGYYGETGSFNDHNLPVNDCCDTKPTLRTNYDDEPGFRETVYEVICTKCKRTTYVTSNIEKVIEIWNNGANNIGIHYPDPFAMK